MSAGPRTWPSSSGRHCWHRSTPTRHRRRPVGCRSHSGRSPRRWTRTLRTRRGSGCTRTASRPNEPCCGRNPARCQSPTPTPGSRGRSDQRSSCHSLTATAPNFPRVRTTSSPARQSELQLSLRVQGGLLRSPRAARPPAGLALLSPPGPAPLQPSRRHALRTAISRVTPEKGCLVAGAVGSTALRSHFARASKIKGPTSCFTGQVHRLPDAPQAYEAMITRMQRHPKAASPTYVRACRSLSATAAGHRLSRLKAA
ncbi:hypothetical protein GPN2_10673 [Streptomyces murinus]